jgi:hypothetical protein
MLVDLGTSTYHYEDETDGSAIQLGEHRAFSGDGAAASALSVLASIPVFLVAATQEGWSWVTRRVPFLDDLFTRRSPYRQVPLDDDGEFSFPFWGTYLMYQPKYWAITRTSR